MSPVERRELLHIPTLKIRAYTPEEEARRLQNTYKKFSFYQEHGYQLVLPNQTKYPPEEMSKIDLATFTEKVATELYDPRFYDKGVASIYAVRDVIQKGIKRLVRQRLSWLFIPNEYTIAMTQYGVAGSYNHKEGNVVIRTAEDGTISSNLGPSGTPLHEITHIGTEESIVSKFRLTHPEKERMIDLLCVYLFSDLLPEYSMQPLGDSRIDEFVLAEGLENLPVSIEKYIRQHLR